MTLDICRIPRPGLCCPPSTSFPGVIWLRTGIIKHHNSFLSNALSSKHQIDSHNQKFPIEETSNQSAHHRTHSAPKVSQILHPPSITDIVTKGDISEADRRHAQAQPNQASQPPLTSPRVIPADPESRPGLDIDEGMAEHTTVDNGIKRGIGQGEGSISKAGNARQKRQDAFPSTIPVKQKLGLSSVGSRLG